MNEEQDPCIESHWHWCCHWCLLTPSLAPCSVETLGRCCCVQRRHVVWGWGSSCQCLWRWWPQGRRHDSATRRSATRAPPPGAPPAWVERCAQGPGGGYTVLVAGGFVAAAAPSTRGEVGYVALGTRDVRSTSNARADSSSPGGEAPARTFLTKVPAPRPAAPGCSQ